MASKEARERTIKWASRLVKNGNPFIRPAKPVEDRVIEVKKRYGYDEKEETLEHDKYVPSD